jgi:hypothetical protein
VAASGENGFFRLKAESGAGNNWCMELPLAIEVLWDKPDTYA